MSDGCPHCRTFALENEKLLAELAGMQQEKLRDTREKIALRAMVTRHRRQEDVNRHVMAVARVWRALCSPRASIAPTGKNAELIRVAFINYCKGDHAERRHLLYDCVRGYALRPYDAGYGRRTANPAGAVRRVTAAYIFASEERIEQGAGYYRMAQAKPVEWRMAVWDAATATEALWRDLALQEWRQTPKALRIPAPDAEGASHLFLDDGPQEPAQQPEPQHSLFVIEGGREAA